MYRKSMETDINAFTKTYTTCQKFKQKTKKYSKLPPKQEDLIPWECVYVDLVGPYTVTDKPGCDRVLNAMTFIDTATTGWFEITEILHKRNIVTCVCVCVRMTVCTYVCQTLWALDKGSNKTK